MSETLTQVKRETLKQEIELLVEQYKAVSDSSLSNLDPIKKPVLEREKKRLEQELSEKQVELGDLEAQPGEHDNETVETTVTRTGQSSRFDPRQRNARPPQEILPYLLDRSEQEEKLIKAMVKHHREKPQRPFICVIHGDELECHTLYMKRLKIRSLPEILREWYQEAKKFRSGNSRYNCR
jgi:hypothetical protein